MKFLIFAFVITTPNFLFASEQSFQCLKALKDSNQKFQAKDESILLKCIESDNTCPFSSGSYSSSLNSIALPFNNKGDRGVVIYRNGESHFIKLPTKGIKNDEKRQLKYKINNEEVCLEFSRTFGVSKDGMYKPLYNVISNVSDYLNSSFIGYNVNFKNKDECKVDEVISANGLSNSETEKLLNDAIHREIQEKSYMELNIDLRKDMLKAIWMPEGCTNTKCAISTKEKYDTFVKNLNLCKKINDPELNKLIDENLAKIEGQAKAIGLIKEDKKEKANSSSRQK